MKLFPAVILPVALVFLTFSCVATPDSSRKYPNMVADIDPIPVGSIDAEFDRMLSSRVTKLNVDVIFYPRLNSVALEFRHEFTTFRQFWDELSRQQFAAALERYKEDYAARKLVDKYGKTKSVYGKAQGRLEWEAFRYTETYVSSPIIEIGYRFKESTPFFATLMRSAREDKEVNENLAESSQINMYFTRAQADELVTLFDQNSLITLISGIGRPSSLILDSYSEFEEVKKPEVVFEEFEESEDTNE